LNGGGGLGGVVEREPAEQQEQARQRRQAYQKTNFQGEVHAVYSFKDPAVAEAETLRRQDLLVGSPGASGFSDISIALISCSRCEAGLFDGQK
jgi:hypothetical protein